jgi:hypothetical protein
MDDDVHLVESEVEKTIANLNHETAGFFVVEVSDETGIKRKKYLKRGGAYSRFKTLNIGTIEVIVLLSAVRANNVRFPTFMGAGSDLPVSDEAVFLSRLLENGIKGVHLGMTPLIHPAESSGTCLSTSFYISKAVAFKLIFGRVVGLLLFSLFIIKNFKKAEVGVFPSAIKLSMVEFWKRGSHES